MRSRRHLTRQSVGHLWHFIKCRLPALNAARERQRVDADGNNKNGEGRRHSREQCAQRDAADGNDWEEKSSRETCRPVFVAQSGFIMWWSRGICRICIAVAVAVVYEEDADISPRPRMPRRTFNIGNGLRIAADCESADCSFPDYESPQKIDICINIQTRLSRKNPCRKQEIKMRTIHINNKYINMINNLLNYNWYNNLY